MKNFDTPSIENTMPLARWRDGAFLTKKNFFKVKVKVKVKSKVTAGFPVCTLSMLGQVSTVPDHRICPP
jgi:hypothetical protein